MKGGWGGGWDFTGPLTIYVSSLDSKRERGEDLISYNYRGIFPLPGELCMTQVMIF